jgi:hypothetical protein
MLGKLSLSILGISIIAISSVDSAEALTIIDFEPLNDPGTGDTDVGTSYSEDGFTLKAPNLRSINSPSSRFNGSTSLFDNTFGGVTTLIKDGGGLFSLNSIDLDWLNGVGPVPVNFVGTKADSSTILANFTLDQDQGFETFNFSGFNDLVSVSWEQEPGFHHIDNIVLDREPIPEPIPEPLTILGTIVAGCFGVGMKRKKQSQSIN